MSRSPSEVLLVFRGKKETWESLNTILPAVARTWVSAAGPGRFSVRTFGFSRKETFELVSSAVRAAAIVFPFFTPEVASLIVMLRKHLDIRTPFILHLHGEPTRGGFILSQEALACLSERDTFIAASKADARALLAFHPNARVRVIPFPIAIPKLRPRGPRPKVLPFFYVGRISEQKNLHSLLFAFSLLRRRLRNERLELHLFGRPDGLGSPNMGLKGGPYHQLLRKMARELGLGRSVKWRGFVRGEGLLREVYSKPHIFVSPTLHSDENFGVAAWTSLMLGNPAVLSAWGGHLDLIEKFGPMVAPVRVYGRTSGPFVSPIELEEAMFRSLSLGASAISSSDPVPKIRKAYRQLVEEVKILESGAGRANARALEVTPDARRALARRFPGGTRVRPVYTGYDDPVAARAFAAYGMTRPVRAPDWKALPGQLLFPPWARLTPGRGKIRRFSVRDPHRGVRTVNVELKGAERRLTLQSTRTLIENGWAFPVQEHFVGINKGGHHASVCLITEEQGRADTVVYLRERMTRVKSAGGFPSEGIRIVASKIGQGRAHIAESSYFSRPVIKEMKINRFSPFFDALRKAGLERFSSRLNSDLRFIPHHFCHAMAAVAISPFKKALVIVLDGSGSSPDAFPSDHEEIRDFPPHPPVMDGKTSLAPEACTVYLSEGARIRSVHKEWAVYRKDGNRDFSDGLGKFYEDATIYCFNSKFEAGKLMGLAPFGRAEKITDRFEFLRGLDPSRAFKKRGKESWERSGEFEYYADIAASVQAHFEESLFSLLSGLKERFPTYENLILTGGCALNCVANQKVLESGLFRRVYVPPFPGDESIGFGAAAALRYHFAGRGMQPTPMNRQRCNFGPLSSSPTNETVFRAFGDTGRFTIVESKDVVGLAARLLHQGRILAWFQGPSESGPRALGFRSILVDPLQRGIKDRLNAEVKGRESFRPYGFSCPKRYADLYCDVPRGFESPFMSFAPKIRERYRKRLREVSHVDGTSRIQTVTPAQNPLFHQLLMGFGRLSGIYALLNTSLNIMGEPIVETVEDARRFLEEVPVDGLIAGNFFIQKRR